MVQAREFHINVVALGHVNDIGIIRPRGELCFRHMVDKYCEIGEFSNQRHRLCGVVGADVKLNNETKFPRRFPGFANICIGEGIEVVTFSFVGVESECDQLPQIFSNKSFQPHRRIFVFWVEQRGGFEQVRPPGDAIQGEPVIVPVRFGMDQNCAIDALFGHPLDIVGKWIFEVIKPCRDFTGTVGQTCRAN